ncbi:MAG: TonB-dependent receptor [Gammaproteobacteria bacterium]|nr:TonB-dependent receptor [Gammaproteobacteria bacterium]
MTGASFASGVQAPEESNDNDRFGHELIDQIVVVAHKDERSIRDVAANVSIVSRATLRDELASSLDELFRYVPGLDYEAAGSRFGTEGINIRGIGGNRVAILVDGVPLSDQFDVGSFSNATRDFLDTGLIDRVEVLHGPASALYGSSAIGGVVAVATPDPSTIARGRRYGGDALLTWRGRDQSRHAQGSLALQGDVVGFLAGVSRRDGQQHEPAAVPENLDTRDFLRETALLKLVADDALGNTWRASFIHQAADTTSSLNSLLGQGRYRSTTALEGDDRYRMQLVNLSYGFGSPNAIFDAGIVRAFAQQASVEQQTLDERALARTPVSIDRYFEFEQNIAGIEMNVWKEFVGTRISHRLGFGVEFRERRTEEFRDGLSTDLESGLQTNVLLGEVFPLRDFPISTSTETAAFVEDTISIGDWTLVAALRADRFRMTPDTDPMYAEDYPFADPVSIDTSDVSPKLGLIWKAGSGLDLYAQYSHGFRAPPYADANISLEIPFFNYRAIPNPELTSESSDGFDLGMRYRSPRVQLHLSAFHSRYDDFIESKVNLGVDPVSGRTLFQSQNLRSTTIAGFEAAMTLRFGSDRWPFEFSAAAYHARGENDETGEALNSVGPAEAVLQLGWQSPDRRRELRLATTFTSAWDDRDETRGELFKPAGHGIVDLYLKQALGDNANIRAGLHNIGDRTYWHWADVRGLAPDDPLIPFLSRAGRSLSVSLNVTW